jgi:hypothetical protein
MGRMVVLLRQLLRGVGRTVLLVVLGVACFAA